MIKRVLACSTSDGSYAWFLVDKNVYDRKVGGPEYKLLHDILTREAYFYKDSEVQPYDKVVKSDDTRFSATVDGLNFDIRLGTGTIVHSYVISRYNESYHYSYQNKGWVLEPWWPWIKEQDFDDISASMNALIHNMNLVKDMNSEPLSARCGIVAELFKKHDDADIKASNATNTVVQATTDIKADKPSISMLEPPSEPNKETSEAQPAQPQELLDAESKLEEDPEPEVVLSASEPEPQLESNISQQTLDVPTVLPEAKRDTMSQATYPEEQTTGPVNNEEVNQSIVPEELNDLPIFEVDKVNIEQPKTKPDSAATLPKPIQNQQASYFTVQPKKQKKQGQKLKQFVPQPSDDAKEKTPNDIKGMTHLKRIKKPRIPPLESSNVAPSTPDQSVGVDLPEQVDAPAVAKREAWGEQKPVTQDIDKTQVPEQQEIDDKVSKVENWAQKRELQQVNQGKPYNLKQLPRFQLTEAQIQDIKKKNRAAREEKERLKKQKKPELQIQNA